MTDLTAGGCIWSGYDKSFDTRLFYVLFLITGIAFLVLFLKNKKRSAEGVAASVKADADEFWNGNKKISMFVNIVSLLLPFSFLSYYRFIYKFGEGDIQLFYSGRWKAFCLAAFLVFLGAEIYLVFVKKSVGINLPALIMIAINGSMHTPEGILSVDFFHNGETALPMQQLLSYGKLPYAGIDPIHGLCDYYYSLINHVFFDGKYFSQSVSSVVGEVFIAALIALVIGLLYNDSKAFEREKAALLIWLFLPFIVSHMGMRYVFFIVGFFILCNEKIRKEEYAFVIAYALLCVVAILWNVSIGGAFAVAFLPGALYRIFKKILPSIKSIKKGQLAGLAVAFIACVFFVFPFIKILKFLKENTGSTLYVNGNPIFGADFNPVATFGIFIPLLFAFIYGVKRREYEIFMPMILSLLVLVSYACVRYDEGERLLVLAVFFSFFLIVVSKNMMAGSKTGFIMPALCMVLTIYFTISLLPFMRPSMKAEAIPDKMTFENEVTGVSEEDAVVYLNGESVGMPALGTGFIRGTTLQSLQNVKSVLQGESFINGDGSLADSGSERCVLDLTNKISHLVIFDLENITPYSSAYNMSTTEMQKRALSYIEERQPDLILVSPYICFDEAPLSLRSFYLYTHLMDMGYEPYEYGDAVYLLKGESTFTDAVDGRRKFALLMHKEQLGCLPMLWNEAWDKMPDEDKTELKDDVLLLSSEEANEMKVSEGKAEYKFKSDIDGEEHRFIFDIKDGAQGYLIPIGSSPF